MQAREGVASGVVLLLMLATAAPASAYTEAQRERGSTVYVACAQCHTLDGPRVGGKRALVGKDALPPVVRHTYRPSAKLDTAADLADYIQAMMPISSPGTLSMDDAFAVTSFLLASNGVPADGVPFDRTTAVKIKLDDVLPQRKSRLLPIALGGGAVIALAIGGVVVVRRRRSPS